MRRENPEEWAPEMRRENPEERVQKPTPEGQKVTAAALEEEPSVMKWKERPNPEGGPPWEPPLEPWQEP
jgi:hypothetical protein